MTDGDLVRLVVAGDTAAYGVLARRWFYRILAFCQSHLYSGRRHDAEDLTQEVLLRGMVDLASLSEPDNYGPWIRGVANHVCADWGRDHKRDQHHLQRLESQSRHDVDCDSSTDLMNDERELIYQQIATIPSDCREVILLHYYEDLTYDEMARWLGVARATVNERLAKARGLLRIRLARLRSDV